MKQNPQSLNKKTQAVCYHDGECPVCQIEVKMMRKLDKENAIEWIDITKDKQALDVAGITYQQAMDRIHVLDDEKQIVKGVRGFMALWKHLPYYRRLVPVIQRVPFLLGFLEAGYSLFARYRLVLTGRTSHTEVSK